jgi:hypothetical protein
MIIVLLQISASLIYKMSSIQLKLKNKYPKISCDKIYNLFLTDSGDGDAKNWSDAKLTESKDLLEFMHEAVREYENNLPKKGEPLLNNYEGIMGCWCNYMWKMGQPTEYEYTSENSIPEPIC